MMVLVLVTAIILVAIVTGYACMPLDVWCKAYVSDLL